MKDKGQWYKYFDNIYQCDVFKNSAMPDKEFFEESHYLGSRYYVESFDEDSDDNMYCIEEWTLIDTTEYEMNMIFSNL